MAEMEQISPPILTTIVEKINTMVVNGDDIGWVAYILPDIFLCAQQNREMYTGLEQLKGE